jgi:hypothetical protein
VKPVGAIAAMIAVGCAASVPVATPTTPARMAPSRVRVPDVELFFRGDQPFARRGAEEWALGDVTKPEMVFSPDRKRFAYVRQKEQGPTRIMVRNLAGDPINEFGAYKPGRPEELTWLDNRRIGYLATVAAASKPQLVYVVHDAETGEVLAARTGGEMLWSPQHRHVAFVTGTADHQALVVDGKNVWPRRGLTRIKGTPVWSPDGHGLALVEDGGFGPRLVVLVEFDDASGDLTWVIPREALAPGLRVFWAGDNKVVIGETALRPRFAADWERLR